MTTTQQLDAEAPIPTDGARARLLATMPVTERRMEIAGVSTAVLEGGHGPPVVLLHGPGEFAATWTRVIPSLVTTHHVLAPDLPGHGASQDIGAGGGVLDTGLLLAWLDELITGWCESPPVLVGHLLGGSLAARHAASGGTPISGLVLVDSYGLARLRPAPGFAFALARFVARPTARSQRALMRRCLADRDGLGREMGGRLETMEAYALEGANAPGARTTLRRLMPGLGVPAIPEEMLGRIAVPTTLIWGRDDRQVRLAVAEAASLRFGWPLHVIDGSAGDPAIEQPKAFVQALRATLRSEETEEIEETRR